MADEGFAADLVQAAAAVAALAGDEDRFRATFDAFLAADRESYQRLLTEFQLLDRCELVCDWICSKNCVLVCLELCGPPADVELPDLREFAAVVTRITQDEELVERLANTVADRDAEGFGALVAELKIERFCHLLCHWACSVRCRLLCHVVCSPTPTHVASFVEELAQAGAAITTLAADEQAMAEITEAVLIGNCEVVRGVVLRLGLFQRCQLICEWLCTWRCVRVCLLLCRRFPPEPIEDPLGEAFAFARATARLAANPAALQRLGDAVAKADPETFGAVVDELELGRFCIQLCHWLCQRICHVFCVCVCPPSSVAVFTKIGDLFYEFDVASGLGGNGLTIADRRAFFQILKLNGGLALVSGAPQIQYRFELAPTDVNGNPTGPWKAVPGDKILAANIGQFITAGPPFIMEVWVNGINSATSYSITPASDGWVTVPTLLPPFPPPPPPGLPVPPGVLEFVPGSTLAVIDTGDPALFQAWPATAETGVVAGQAAHVAPVPGSNLGTTSAAIGPGTVTALPVSALPAAIPGGIGISVGGVTFRVGAAGAAAAATSIPVESQAVAGPIAASQTVMALNAYYGIRMRLRNVGDSSDGSDAGTCAHIAINNTLYDNVKRAYTTVSGQFGVYEIGVQELVTNICGDIQPGTIHVLFTAAHPNLGGVGITITGNGIFEVPVPLPPPVPINWHGSVPYSIAGLPDCAYILTLSVDVLLTDGKSGPGPLLDQIAFCKR